MIAMKRGRVWWIRGLGVALLVPLCLWLSGCWLFNVPPVASFTMSLPVAEIGQSVSFTAVTSIDEDGVIVGYAWDFGDGTDGSGRSVSHTYTAVGAYTVILIVTDDDGESAQAQKTIYIEAGEPPGPTASFTASPISGNSPLNVFFDASGSTYDQTPLTYTWDFGDGSTGYGRQASHLYNTSTGATYTVTLTVTGPDGKSGTTTRTITVSGAGGGTEPTGSPSARFDIEFPDTNDEVAPVRAEFDPDDSEPDDGRVIATYTWSFGDGTAANSVTADVQEHTFITDEASEIFSVTLVVIDDEGATDDITKTVRVKNHQPVAGFEILDAVQQPPAAGPPNDPDVPSIAGTWEADDVTVTGMVAGDVRVWIRSRNLVADGDWIKEKTSADPDANGANAKPADYDDNNFSFDPEGQTWDNVTGPAWFPNRAWGIKRLRISWGDGNSNDVDFEDAADTVASHTYAFGGTSKTYRITVVAEDYLGAEDTFYRDITLAP